MFEGDPPLLPFLSESSVSLDDQEGIHRALFLMEGILSPREELSTSRIWFFC